jgi:hypothetical protein
VKPSENAFKETSQLEKLSEPILIPWLRSRGWTFSQRYPPRDDRGDYRVTKGNAAYDIELKADSHTATGNFFIEIFSNMDDPKTHLPKLGWVFTSKAHKLFYHFIGTDWRNGNFDTVLESRLHIFDMKKLRRYLYSSQGWSDIEVKGAPSVEQGNSPMGFCMKTSHMALKLSREAEWNLITGEKIFSPPAQDVQEPAQI